MSKSREPQAAEAAPEAVAAGGSRWLRPLSGLLAWTKAHKRMTLLIGGAGLLLLVGLTVALFLVRGPTEPERPQGLDAMLAALDEGELERAQQLADDIDAAPGATEEDHATCLFVKGVAAAEQAESGSQDESKAKYRVAARALEEAKELEFPHGRTAQGLYWLGKSLYHTRQYAASRAALEEVLPAMPEKEGELRWLLAGTCLQESPPNLKRALEENGHSLDESGLSVMQRTARLLQRAQIQLAAGDAQDCLATVAQMPADVQRSADVLLIRGQVQLQEARGLARRAGPDPARQAAATARYQEAAKTLRQAQSADTLSTYITRAAMYLIGLCFLETNDAVAATTQFGRVERLFPRSAEALAASVEEADLLRAAGHRNDSLVLYRQVLKEVAEDGVYDNRWLGRDQLRTRVMKVFQESLVDRDYVTCLELVGLFVPLFAKERAAELKAEVRMAWARHLFNLADAAPTAKQELLRRDARGQMRQAGEAYRELAELAVSQRRYPDELWNCAQAYLEGHDYREVARALREYLKHESRRRQADALCALGESLLAQGELEPAQEAFSDCMTRHPRDAATFRARLFASRTAAEQGDQARAEALLLENLNAEFLTPASAEWRESLFDLGRMLHAQQRFDEALAKLEEAVIRYPESPRALETQYLAADCYRQRARRLQQSLKDVLVENTRILRTKQIHQSLIDAADRFRKLRDGLTQRHEAGNLSPLEQAIYRNASLAVGDCLFELRQYDDAIKAYMAAINRFQNTPAILGAYTQIAAAYRRLDRPQEARSAIEQAKGLLSRLNDDAAFTQTSIYTKQQWSDLLNRLANG